MQVREQKVPPQMYGPGPPGVLHEREQKMAPQMYGPGPPGVLYDRPHTLRDYGQVAPLHYSYTATLQLHHYATATSLLYSYFTPSQSNPTFPSPRITSGRPAAPPSPQSPGVRPCWDPGQDQEPSGGSLRSPSSSPF